MKIIYRVQTFLKSLFWHVSRGLPKSGKDQILIRYNICLDCESFNNKEKICNECGCNISNKNIFLNKLAWADQECPLGKWGKLTHEDQTKKQ
jgi:hypothetical protein